MNNKQITLITCGVLLLCFTLLAGCPVYNVWTEEMNGKAKLAHASYSKEVQVAEAKGAMEASEYYARADTNKAHGTAWSNRIIGQSLINNPLYLEFLWINEINKNNNVMYVATEAGLPIVEAGRLGQLQAKKEAEVKAPE